jgi:energy-coupling factor transport system ATP-binding protein
MAVQTLRLTLEGVRASQESWSITAQGTFGEGLHLVSGDVGSGKSTLALLMAGLSAPSSGQVTRDGISSVMVSFQFPEYHITGTSVREECESWGLDPATLLSSVGLEACRERDPFSLSRGELKRLHLACVLPRGYDLLILDEPFSSLDVVEKHRICNILSHRSRGITILFSHEQTIFPRVDHIWEILEGRLRYCGSPPESFSNWQHVPPIIQRLVAAGKTPANISADDLKEAAWRT